MCLLVHDFMAEKKVDVTLTYIEKAFVKSNSTTLYQTMKILRKIRLFTRSKMGPEFQNLYFAPLIVYVTWISICICISLQLLQSKTVFDRTKNSAH